MDTITCRAGRGYTIAVGDDVISQTGRLLREVTPAGRVAIVSDSNVAPLYAETLRKSLTDAGFGSELFVFAAGERSKTHETLLSIYAFLADQGFTRAEPVVALGGGVVGDVAGFAAATWQRGVDVVQVPTSLLAQVDSSVGGKTAVDLPAGKNLVGAFHQPRLVVCDTRVLQTLPPRYFTDGMAEVLKYGCIRDAALFGLLAQGAPSGEALARVVRRCIEIKCAVVERDEHESGERMLLNFGHTLGHAIERVYQYETFSHGEAVAMGMAAAARAGERAGLTEPGASRRIVAALSVLGLPTELPVTVAKLAGAALSDKKRSGGNMRLALLARIGEGFVHTLPAAELGAFFAGCGPEPS